MSVLEKGLGARHDEFYRILQYCYDPAWIQENADLFERRVQESLNSRRPAQTVLLQQLAIGKYDVTAKLASIPDSVPVLVIHGTLDVTVDPSAKEHILKGIKHARLAECPRSDFGHNW